MEYLKAVLVVLALLWIATRLIRFWRDRPRAQTRQVPRRDKRKVNASSNKARFGIEELARRLETDVDSLLALRPTYRETRIPKRNGKDRVLHVPDEPTKAMQRRILRRLFAKIHAHGHAMGFEQGRSIVDHAERHVGSAAVVHLDVIDFFPKTTTRRVKRFYERLGWDASAVKVLLELTTYQGGLPQGAPTSPRLSNLVNLHLDRRLVGLAKAFGASYTRYADDLTFSFTPGATTEQPAASQRAAQEQALENHHAPDRTHLPLTSRIRAVIRTTEKILEQYGYTVHRKQKRSVARAHRRQQVTGLVVNQRVGLPRQTRRWLRAVEHRVRKGTEANLTVRQLHGWLAFEKQTRRAGWSDDEKAYWAARLRDEDTSTTQAGDRSHQLDAPSPTANPHVAATMATPLIDREMVDECTLRDLSAVAERAARLNRFDSALPALVDSWIGRQIMARFIVEQAAHRLGILVDEPYREGRGIVVRDLEQQGIYEIRFPASAADRADQPRRGDSIEGSFRVVEWDSIHGRWVLGQSDVSL